ncbi:Proteasome subunit alpha type-2 [Boothiomyces sp. JEL0838]|nr:Proteasome subunit alpha type-2 [Boothiomyces sp. JEL0838]
MSYKGVILVGGPSVGTRFRPLSMDYPKPLFPIAGHPIIYHHVHALAKIPGIKEILLIGFFEQSVFDRFLTEMQIEFPHVQIRYLREYQSMGTAGGIHHFRDEILRGNPDAFFVLNGDIACSFPLIQMLATHRQSNGLGTVLSMRERKDRVNRYGCLVVNPETKEVDHFVEKPESFVSDLISCGVYLFGKDLFNYITKAIEIRRTKEEESGADDTWNSLGTSNASLAARSNERVQLEQDVLPLLTGKKLLYSHTMSSDDFWMPIKTGSSTITANRKYLQYFMQAHPRRLSVPSVVPSKPKTPEFQTAKESPEIIAPAYIHPTAVIHPSAKIGPNAFIGARALIGRGVRVRDALILDAVEIKNDSCILNSVVGWESKIGAWCRVEGSTHDEVESHAKEDATTQRGFKIPSACIFGKGVTVADELVVRDCIVLPHKEIKNSFQREILM